MQTTCQGCGRKFKQPGNHWRAEGNDCSYPSISGRTLELVEGLLMGDGTISPRNRDWNPPFELQMSNLEFLEYLQAEGLSHLATSLTQQRDEDDSRKVLEESGMIDDADGSGVSSYYCLRLVSHPRFSEMRDRWYPSGDKQFPEDLSLTPLKAKMWYVCDGTVQYEKYNGTVYRPRISFSCVNEEKRPEYLRGLFQSIGIEATVSGKTVSLPYDETDSFYEYIGEPVPGFEHKW